MTAEQVFDPEAIAARVFEREQQQLARVLQKDVPEPGTEGRPSLARAVGSHVTGAGDTRGRPLPTTAESSEDIFDRLERQRAAHAVRSPFGDHPTPNRYATDIDDDPDRFVAPDLADEDDEEPETPAPQPRSAPAAAATPPAQRSAHKEPAGEQAPPEEHDPRCGTQLTGGGAPRGWVLIRIIGQGTPRRYCSTDCAVTVLEDPRTTPAPAAPTQQPKTRGRRQTTVDRDDVACRYQAGETAPAIATALGTSAKTVRWILDEAGVQRRDDRTGHSGGRNRIHEDDPQLVARVRALYELHQLSQAQVAEALNTSVKVVQGVMARNGIQARPSASHSQHGHAVPNNSKRITDRLNDLGITSRQVKEWAQQAGLITGVRRGACPEHLIEAYLAAHTNGASA